MVWELEKQPKEEINMGGQEGIKGYLYQSFMAVLNSLNKDWESITVEPDTVEEKIDIVWVKSNSTEVCQVKSSINDFSIPNVLKWIRDMYEDISDADCYSVILVGNSDQKHKLFFRSLDSKEVKDFQKYPEVYEIRDKVKVTYEPDNLKTLEDASITCLERFLYSKEVTADIFTKELILGGMVKEIFKVSTTGESMTKFQFESLLLSWLDSNFADQVHYKKPILKLTYYLQNKINFSKTISKISLLPIEIAELYRSNIRELKVLFEDIDSYKLPENRSERVTDNSLLGNNFMSSFAQGGVEVVIDSSEQERIINFCRNYLDKQLSKGFFNFGNLKEERLFNVAYPIGHEKKFIGPDNAIEKKKSYNKFSSKVNRVESLLNYWALVTKYAMLPIVLENRGSALQNDVTVQLFFPKGIEVLDDTSFPMPESYSILKELTDEGSFLFLQLKQFQNSVVREYDSGYVNPPFFSYGFLQTEIRRNKEEEFRWLLRNIFDYNYYNDNSEYTILECHFKEINTSEVIALPAFIFFRSNEDLKIRYKISCRNLTEAIHGELLYNQE